MVTYNDVDRYRMHSRSPRQKYGHRDVFKKNLSAGGHDSVLASVMHLYGYTVTVLSMQERYNRLTL
jgi:RNA:NAD 2'-phosphotransferase (TPT1/KptA family)